MSPEPSSLRESFLPIDADAEAGQGDLWEEPFV